MNWSDITSKANTPEKFIEFIRGIEHNRLTKQFPVGEDIPAGSAVYVHTDGRIYLFDVNNTSQYDKYVGITESVGILTGCKQVPIVTVITQGIIHVGQSGWQAGIPYYIGTNSKPSSTPPPSGLQRVVGVGVDRNRILLMPPNTTSGGGGNTGDCCGSIDGGFADETYCDFIDGGGALI